MSLYEIVEKTCLAPRVYQWFVQAPAIADKHRPGQFVIIQTTENSERIPLTIVESRKEQGLIRIIFQKVGKSTSDMAALQPGDSLFAVAGPLGTPTHLDMFGSVVCIGGGIGAAPLLPIARGLKERGNQITGILGARSKELLILEPEMRELSKKLYITTDDGSAGEKGFVTDVLKQIIESGQHIDQVVTIGPPVMMKMTAETTRAHAISTVASLNTIMVDGTGMCGGCRIHVNDETKFVCVDGPEFDAHQVDWDEMLKRQNIYRDHECRLFRNQTDETL
ncbi:MAG: sulfide/dihydroorotate dehydrogenase-like FAD/NAD-binding protein [candidate division KSB1 bacterium]|nr:sulfide/dihydroorotate dehydrogenase-like FAD/NAD-binding protein [candidate division KSB1 bacterium]